MYFYVSLFFFELHQVTINSGMKIIYRILILKVIIRINKIAPDRQNTRPTPVQRGFDNDIREEENEA